ncbi:MAG TPA: phosphodiester glycosidase family protein [Streptosporangiaceae bacterium]
MPSSATSGPDQQTGTGQLAGREQDRAASLDLPETSTAAREAGLSTPARRPRLRRLRRLSRLRSVRIAAALLAAFACVVGWSVGNALTAPGGGTVAERLAEWARDHYLGPVVTFGEWLAYQPPKVGGQPSFALTGPSAGPALLTPARPRHRQHGKKPGSAAAAYGPPARLSSPAGRPLHGEGKWRVLATVRGLPAIYGTYLRPDKIHTSYVAGIVSMNQQLVRFELHPGSEDPGPGNWHSAAVIAPGSRRGLVATFNGGFKISTSDGGFYLNGDRRGTLTPGVASLVYYKNGNLGIGDWDRGGLRMSGHVAGVRQNLHLIVSGGKVPAAVDNNVEASWGATLGGAYYVWRSGIGITAGGRIIFVYGPALDVRTLAALLKRAGAVSAMQLDINPDWMSYMYYLPKHHPGNPAPVNLLPDQVQPPGRYYTFANRDFTAVYSR